MALTEEKIYEQLKTVYDPEIPVVSIVDLGLIYEVAVNNSKVDVKMTLTAPGCPMAGFIANMAKEALEKMDEVDEANVEVVFDPPWNPGLMTDEGKKLLGFDG
ncbi:MAG: metal-sulfur cluster assembly factor [bacterium]|nr:metal-sulfur cluster assembly factor [bacterium]